MATLKDIAEIVGVSITTVSRILNHDKSMSVSEDTQKEIFRVANELKYVKPQSKTANRIKAKMLDENNSIKNETKEERLSIQEMSEAYNEDTPAIVLVHKYTKVQELEDPYFHLVRYSVEDVANQNGLKVIRLMLTDKLTSMHIKQHKQQKVKGIL